MISEAVCPRSGNGVGSTPLLGARTSASFSNSDLDAGHLDPPKPFLRAFNAVTWNARS